MSDRTLLEMAAKAAGIPAFGAATTATFGGTLTLTTRDRGTHSPTMATLCGWL